MSLILLRTLCGLACAITAVSAADSIVLVGGKEVVGEIIGLDARNVIIRVDGALLTYERARVTMITRGGAAVVAPAQPKPAPGRQAPATPAPVRQPEAKPKPAPARAPDAKPKPPAPGKPASAPRAGSASSSAPSPADDAPRWSFDAGVAAGWSFGEVTGTGRVLSTATGASADISTSADLAGFALVPGGWLRATYAFAAPESSWLVGAQLGVGGVSDSAASLTQQTFSVVGGWMSAYAEQRTYVEGRLGIARGSVSRTLQVTQSGGSSESVDDSADLSGWSAGIEAGVVRRASWLDYGLALGLEHSQLSGSSSWRSASGAFTADEDLEATVTVAYVSVLLGVTW